MSHNQKLPIVSDLDKQHASVPTHLWIVGSFALLWNLAGGFDTYMILTGGEEYMRLAKHDELQIEHISNMPLWRHIVGVTANITAIIAAIMLLLRSRLAFYLFGASFIAFLVQHYYSYFLVGDGLAVFGMRAISHAVIGVICIFFLWYSWAMLRRNVLSGMAARRQ